MGRDQVSLEIHFYVSRHNSPQDTIDDEAVADFRAALGALLANPRYRDLAFDLGGCEAEFRDMDHDRRNRVSAMLGTARLRARRRVT